MLPTDTVYGLCADAYRPAPARGWPSSRAVPKGCRSRSSPPSSTRSSTACPELRGRFDLVAQALLPGPFTLVLPNPAHRFAWLDGRAAGHDRHPRPRAPRRARRGASSRRARSRRRARTCTAARTRARVDEIPRGAPRRGRRGRGRGRAARDAVHGRRSHRGGARDPAGGRGLRRGDAYEDRCGASLGRSAASASE